MSFSITFKEENIKKNIFLLVKINLHKLKIKIL